MSAKLWPIWMEGYRATGDYAHAEFQGTWPGETFAEACSTWAGSDPFFNREKLTYWGCRLFDNETDARKSFG